jgi:hypothetical protein
MIASNKKSASAELLFRMLVCTIFSDDQFWINSDRSTIEKDHDAEVSACYSKNKYFRFLSFT